MNFRQSALSIVSTLCILVGTPALSFEPDRNGYSGKDHYVNVCVEKRSKTTCFNNVPYDDPDLRRFTQRHKPEVNKRIPWLSDAYESGLLFWGILLYLVGVSSVAVGWMILNWKKIRPTDPR